MAEGESGSRKADDLLHGGVLARWGRVCMMYACWAATTSLA